MSVNQRYAEEEDDESEEVEEAVNEDTSLDSIVIGGVEDDNDAVEE